MLGEEGTEQFTVVVETDGKAVATQSIHDPFIHTEVVTVLSRWACFLGLFMQRRRTTVTRVAVHGSKGAERAIMTLDPVQLSRDTKEILEGRRISRETTSSTSNG